MIQYIKKKKLPKPKTKKSDQNNNRSKMEPINFACIIYELEKLHDVYCDADITAHMYNLYLESMYEAYTLFELISILNANRIIIDCALNKREIIKMIIRNKIEDIPYPSDDEEHKTIWYVDSKRGLWIGGGLQQIKIKYNDVFCINNKNYKIICIKPLPYNKFKHKYEHTIILKNIENSTECLKMTVENFMRILDTKDVTIVKSMYIENIQELYKLGQNRFIKWKCPTLESNIDQDDENIPSFI
jgi:hypothetical protein